MLVCGSLALAIKNEVKHVTWLRACSCKLRAWYSTGRWTLSVLPWIYYSWKTNPQIWSYTCKLQKDRTLAEIGSHARVNHSLPQFLVTWETAPKQHSEQSCTDLGHCGMDSLTSCLLPQDVFPAGRGYLSTSWWTYCQFLSTRPVHHLFSKMSYFVKQFVNRWQCCSALVQWTMWCTAKTKLQAAERSHAGKDWKPRASEPQPSTVFGHLGNCTETTLRAVLHIPLSQLHCDDIMTCGLQLMPPRHFPRLENGHFMGYLLWSSQGRLTQLGPVDH